MTFESLMMIYLTDFNLMSQGFYDGSLLLPATYSAAIIDLQNSTYFEELIDREIDSLLQKVHILQIAMSVLIGLMVIPILCFLR